MITEVKSDEYACFVNTNAQPISAKHISYFCREEQGDKYKVVVLYEVIEYKYPHPDAPDMATVNQIKVERVREKPVYDAGELYLLMCAQETVYKINHPTKY